MSATLQQKLPAPAPQCLPTMGVIRCHILSAILCSVFFTTSLSAEPKADVAPSPASSPAPDPFAMLSLERELPAIARHLNAGRLPAAEKLLRETAGRYPQVAELLYGLAVIQARQGMREAALASLESAINAGFTNARHMEGDINLAPLRSDPRFAVLTAQVRKAQSAQPDTATDPVQPTLVTDGTAHVTAMNTRWDGRIRALRSFFSFAPAARKGLLVHEGTGPVARMLNRWYARGRAAGNHGDLYDNRDRDHSNLKPGILLQIAHVEYSDAARAADADYRLNTEVFFNAITIGNSSLAVTGGALWRSQPRLTLSSTAGAQRLFRQYANNHLYAYPEHRDHDPGIGDLFPANTPYLVISQGSSGSDQPFVHAMGAILAAFTPETKSFLRSNRLVSPAVQMILRRGMRGIATDEDYLTGAAHPTVFQADGIDLAAMVQRANALTADEVPPLVILEIEHESQAIPGVDHFALFQSEQLFTTPGAIARVVRSTAHARRMVVSTRRTRDPNSRPLTYRWVVLRGDRDRIAIKPLNADGSRAEVIVPWHERATVPGRPDLTTDRVDIGVFADNGRQISAPAFISLTYPATQLREYGEHGRIKRIDYRDPERIKRYADPALFPLRDWIDVYDHDTQGRLTGWTRRRGEEVSRYTRHGARVETTDARNRPLQAMVVRYALKHNAGGTSTVIEQDTGTFLDYAYQDETDRYGTLRKQPQE